VADALPTDAVPTDLEIRPPRQQRSREAWARVLDAGVALLEDGGYDAFTIAALCERAGVAPPAIYARTTNKEALFLAVYEHGIARLAPVQQALEDAAAATPEQVVRAAVGSVLSGMLAQRRFLGAVVLISAAHPEVHRRGAGYAHALEQAFVDLVLAAGDAVTHPDPVVAARTCFGSVFAAGVLRVAWGADFTTAVPVEDAAFVAAQAEAAVRYLLGP
jgi:AcrR family transcriptional regulator